jgi:hypothetical protein
MTHSVNDNLSPDFESWLEEQRGQVMADLRQFLDVEAGLW